MMNQKLSFLSRALGWRALPESLVESRLAADQSQSQTIIQFHPPVPPLLAWLPWLLLRDFAAKGWLVIPVTRASNVMGRRLDLIL